MARHLQPAPHRGRRTRLAPQRLAGHLRPDPPVDARRPAGQHRPEVRGRGLVPGRARHQVLAPPGRASEQEAGPLAGRGRAGRHDAPVRARAGRDRSGLDSADRRPPAQGPAAGAALGEEGRRGHRAGAGHALRHRHLQQPPGELRQRRCPGCARDLHPRGAGQWRVGNQAALPRPQPEADPAGRGAGAQVAPPGRAGRRRADPRLLRRAAAARRGQRRDLRALVPPREQGGAVRAEAAAPDARRADAPRGGRHHHHRLPEDDPAGRHRLHRHLPARPG